MFGIGLTSVAKIVYEFYESIFEEAGQFTKLPANGHETAFEIENFHILLKLCCLRWLAS